MDAHGKYRPRSAGPSCGGKGLLVVLALPSLFRSPPRSRPPSPRKDEHSASSSEGGLHPLKLERCRESWQGPLRKDHARQPGSVVDVLVRGSPSRGGSVPGGAAPEASSVAQDWTRRPGGGRAPRRCPPTSPPTSPWGRTASRRSLTRPRRTPRSTSSTCSAVSETQTQALRADRWAEGQTETCGQRQSQA